jgi:hypothetical protein
MKEKAVTFGQDNHLVGIVAVPDDAVSHSYKPAILFLNAGLLHRVGPYRMSVDLARSLSSEGWLTMRFDLSGIGDSQFTRETAEYREIVKSDIRAAMDFIRDRYKSDTFVLVGLCSGASNAQMVAFADERIVGVVMMDGFAFRTTRFYCQVLKKYLAQPSRAFSASKVILTNQCRRIFHGKVKSTRRPSMFANIMPSRKRLAHEFRVMAEQRLAMLCVYSGGIPDYYKYAGQFFDMFHDVDFRGTLRLEYFAEADHTYSSVSERKKLIACILQWINDVYGAGGFRRKLVS